MPKNFVDYINKMRLSNSPFFTRHGGNPTTLGSL